ATGLGGTTGAGRSAERIERMEPVRERRIRVTFNADTHASIQWNFKPQQSEIYVVPGETALAFYKAKNPTDKPIIGISTYNVVPFEAGQYFNKIQCFCFEEQRLNPQEEVDMPVFFYIDPEFAEDPKMAKVDLITLSYTFFEAKEGQKLPLPGYQNCSSSEHLKPSHTQHITQLAPSLLPPGGNKEAQSSKWLSRSGCGCSV
ncbi:hypothetical protein IHE44_0006879, partial [Lamprotornis superbus]